jgi:hypothetical protein
MIHTNERTYLFFNKYLGKTKDSKVYVKKIWGRNNEKASRVA